MKQTFFRYLFFVLLIFPLLRTGQVLAVSAPPKRPIPGTVWAANIASSVKRFESLIQGSIPKKVYERILVTARNVPVPTSLYGRGIRAGKLFSNLFPKISKKYPLQGILDFKLHLNRINKNRLDVEIKITLKNPRLGVYALHAKKITVYGSLNVDPVSKRVGGTLKCQIVSPSLITGGNGTPLTLSEASSAVSIFNRHYALKMRLNNIACSTLKIGKEHVDRIHIKEIRLTPEKLRLKGLSLHFRKQIVRLKQINFDPVTMKFKIRGNAALSPPFFIKYIPALKGIKGRFYTKLEGSLHPIVVTGDITAPKVEILGAAAPFTLNNIGGHLNLSRDRLAISNLHIAYKKGAEINGEALLKPFQQPLVHNIRGKLRLSVPDIAIIRPLLNAIDPTLLTSLDYRGSLLLTAEGRINGNGASLRGHIDFKGDITDSSLPMACREISLSVPFDYQSTRPSPLIKRHNVPANRQNGFLKIRSIKFGFLPISDFSCGIITEPNKISAGTITFKIFQGIAEGKGVYVLVSPNLWKITLNIKQISLHDLCEHIPGFQDALSGRVITALTLTGNRGKLSSMKGFFSAETVKSSKEPRRISQAFIRKLTGEKGRFFFLQKYRSYNKGIVRATIKSGVITFDTLELSHRFLGFKDLSIIVSRLSNKISIQDLIWEILQASQTNVEKPVIKMN